MPIESDIILTSAVSIYFYGYRNINGFAWGTIQAASHRGCFIYVV